jgi:outer membrane biosynthesis protein TonB
MRIILLTVVILSFSSLGYSQASRADAFDFYRIGQCDNAIPILEKTLAADKKDYAASLYLGGCYATTGKKQEARKAWKSVKPNPKGLPDGLDTKAAPQKRTYARYTDEARNQGITGSVLLAIEIKSNGRIGFIIPIKSLPLGLTENAIRAAREAEWTPGVKDGKNVDSITIREYTFSIY